MKKLNYKNVLNHKSLIKNKGITLIALIVTIIIVLILASVSVAVFSNSNIIKKSKFAGETYQNKINEEEKAMQNYVTTMNEYSIADAGRDEKITISKNEYEDLKNKVNFLYNGITNLKYNDIVSSNVNVPYNTEVTIYEKEFTEDKLVCLDVNAYCESGDKNINYGIFIYLNGKAIARTNVGEIANVDAAAMPNLSQIIDANKGDKLEIRLYQAGKGYYPEFDITYTIYGNI